MPNSQKPDLSWLTESNDSSQKQKGTSSSSVSSNQDSPEVEN